MSPLSNPRSARSLAAHAFAARALARTAGTPQRKRTRSTRSRTRAVKEPSRAVQGAGLPCRTVYPSPRRGSSVHSESFRFPSYSESLRILSHFESFRVFPSNSVFRVIRVIPYSESFRVIS
jgi:hypothetical protein